MDKTLLNSGSVDDNCLKQEIKKHKVIKISFLDNLYLYVTKALGCDCFDKIWSKRKKLTKLYEKGQDKLETQLNILKIIKSLRNLKILMNNSMMTVKVKQ